MRETNQMEANKPQRQRASRRRLGRSWVPIASGRRGREVAGRVIMRLFIKQNGVESGPHSLVV